MRTSCKICRRLGVSVCGRDKCAFKRKPYAPGVHGKGTKRRRNVSEYGSQLMAKQIVSHGHIMVNGRRVTVPSLRVRKEDKIIIRPQSVSKGIFKDLDISLKKYIAPPWLALDKEKKEGTVLGRAADVD